MNVERVIFCHFYQNIQFVRVEYSIYLISSNLIYNWLWCIASIYLYITPTDLGPETQCNDERWYGLTDEDTRCLHIKETWVRTVNSVLGFCLCIIYPQAFTSLKCFNKPVCKAFSEPYSSVWITKYILNLLQIVLIFKFSLEKEIYLFVIPPALLRFISFDLKLYSFSLFDIYFTKLYRIEGMKQRWLFLWR